MPLLTADTVAYAQVSAMRSLTGNERESVFLTDPQHLPARQAPALGDDGPGKLCDRLAADPFDPKRASAPVSFAVLEFDKAIPACQAAVKDRPNEPRFKHELARALLRGGRGSATADAIEAMRSAAQRGYAAAIGNLGQAYERGEGVKQNFSLAARLYQQASEKGFLPAFSDLASMYWVGIGETVDREKALELLRSGVEAGDPFSNLRLAELYEQGDGVPKDVQKTFFHYARSSEIFGQLGDEDNRAIPRARLGSLARALSPEQAVRLAREAMDRQPTAQ